jgi:hypothetical protein
MAFAPPKSVEAQPRAGLPFGLFSVVTFRESEDGHVFNGVQWRAMGCGPVSAVEDPGCTTFGVPTEDEPDLIEKDFSSGSLVDGRAEPFLTYATDLCGASARQMQEGEENATAKLLAREEAQAEAAVWRRIALGAVDLTPASGPLEPGEALAALERWIGREYGSLGIIHGDRGAVSLLDTRVASSGNRLATKVGTPVVAGAGYPGTGPTEPPTDEDPSPAPGARATGETWLVASPAMWGYRGQVMASSALDKGRNDHYALAERPYVVAFDPCGTAAVRMVDASYVAP